MNKQQIKHLILLALVGATGAISHWLSKSAYVWAPIAIAVLADLKQAFPGVFKPAAPPAVLALLAVGLSSCATVATCGKSLEQSALQDGLAVGMCVETTGQTLAQCEDAQIATEAGQLTSDTLFCAEQSIASAYSGTHTAAK